MGAGCCGGCYVGKLQGKSNGLDTCDPVTGKSPTSPLFGCRCYTAGFDPSDPWAGTSAACRPDEYCNPSAGQTCSNVAPVVVPSTGSAVGDPHLQNVHGERFDLMAAGSHTLINIPRGELAEKALLRVQAEARRLGGHCTDMYFQVLNVTGSWAEAKKAGGYQYDSSQSEVEAPKWIAFGKVELKIARGSTDSGVLYLNVYAKHLGRTGFAVGGLLGEDDHMEAATPPPNCQKKISLKKISLKAQGGLPSSEGSVAVASSA